jgi:hypothetical protein
LLKKSAEVEGGCPPTVEMTSMQLMAERKPYEAPRIVEQGNVAELTGMHSTGGYTDKAFPAHTPRSELTFSG